MYSTEQSVRDLEERVNKSGHFVLAVTVCSVVISWYDVVSGLGNSWKSNNTSCEPLRQKKPPTAGKRRKFAAPTTKVLVVEKAAKSRFRSLV